MLTECAVERGCVQKISEIETYKLYGVRTVLMSLEKHPADGEVQISFGARKNIERTALRTAPECRPCP